MTAIIKNYGQLLTNYIANKDITQTQLANNLNIPQPTLSRWLSSDFPPLEGIHRITRQFKDPVWKPLVSEVDSIMPRPEWLKPEYEVVIRNLDGLPLEKRIKVLRGLKEFLEAMVEEEGKGSEKKFL